MEDCPYKSPQSALIDNDEKYPRKRNVWIWIIMVYQAWSVLGMLMSYVIMEGRLIPMPQEIQSYYDSIGAFERLSTLASLVLVICTIVFLFRLSRLAVTFFIAEVLFSTVLYIVNIFKNDLLSTYNAFSWLAMILGYAIMFLILWYLSQLKKRGVLR